MTVIPTDIEKKLKAVIRRIEIAAAFDSIEKDNFRDSTSLSSLAKISGLSERSLRNWFKNYTGQTISQYRRTRRIEYAARLFRLFSSTSKSEVSQIIGLNSSNALYPYMRKNGINDIDRLRTIYESHDFTPMNFRFDQLPDCMMFYTQNDLKYDQCSEIEFESKNWDIIEYFINKNIPEAVKLGDVGFAIDRYSENKFEEGIFISGILYKNINRIHISKDLIGDIGWTTIPNQKYAVFTHIGNYNELSDFYISAIQTLQQKSDIQIKKSLLIMEKYLNSPVDTPTENLDTEIWVPIIS